MNFIIQVTYQKRDGSIIHRIRNTELEYNIGDTTSMGWKILNIEYKYQDKFYSSYDYNVIIQRQKQLVLKKNELVELVKNELKKMIYCCLAVLFISFIRLLLGI